MALMVHNPFGQDAADFNMSTGDYLFSMLADEESNWEDYLECDVHE